ncbi:MAG: PP2C family protein-serine/threonine phosphatase [Eubacterium sp.]|nr:PP2C family protein-serine/threonine phosphatase [Eubacterium sp.]
MKAIGRFFNKLSVKIIASITILVTLLTVMIGFFSYQVFTQTMLKESTEYVRETAEAALHNSMSWDFKDYLRVGKERMDDLASLDLYELNKISMDPDVQAFNAYFTTLQRLAHVLVSRDFNVLKIVIPKSESDYSEYSIIFGETISHEENIMELLDLGTVEKVESDEQEDAIRRVWKGESSEEILYSYSENDESDSMVTIIKAMNLDGEPPQAILIAQRSLDNMVQTWKRYVIGITIMGVSMILIGTLIVGLYLQLRVVKPIDGIIMEADRFARENVMAEEELADTVGRTTEIRLLAETIDKMEKDTIKNMDMMNTMSRESERMDTELTLAADLQKNALPKGEQLSGRKEFDVSALMHPAREVGGDFYDFFLIDNTHLVLLIADVSDKGMGAAFFMAVSKTLLKARASMGGSASEIVTFAEEKLSEENENGMFITAWLGIIDLTTGEVNACNAGHNYPAIMKKDTEEGYQLEKTVHGPPICFLPGVPHVEYSFRLEPGDRLFLYTDGVTEAKNPDGERFGNDRLVKALNEDRAIGNESLILRIKAAVDHFAGEEPQFDDITMVSFTFLGSDARNS